MAITGKFAADFTSFYDAVTKAEVSLRSFETGAGKVEGSLNRMVDSFSGRKIIQDATLMEKAFQDLASKGIGLTDRELQRMGATATEAVAKMRAMGLEVPPGLQKIATAAQGVTQAGEGWAGWLGKANSLLGAFGVGISVGAVVSFGRAILADADALTKLHDKTGITVEGLQALRIAGDDAGVSLDSMTTAVNMLQKRLGGDDQSVNKALKDLGINIEQFKRLDGAGQMSAISDAIQGIHDPLRVANDLSALFGRNWAELLPVLKRGFEEIRDETSLTSAFTIKLMDDIGDSIAAMSRRSKGSITEGLGQAIDASMLGVLSLKHSIEQATVAAERGAPKMAAIIPPGLPKDLDALNRAWEEDVVRMKAASEEARRLSAEFKETQKTVQMVEQSVRASRAAGLMGMLADEQKASQQTFEAWLTAYAAIEKAATTQADTSVRVAKEAADEMTVVFIGVAEKVAAVSQKITADFNQAAAQFSLYGGSPSTPESQHAYQTSPAGLKQGILDSFERFQAAMRNNVVPRFDTGGPTRGGLSMLHDGEYVVPKGGALVRGGGGTIINNFYITQPFGTPDAIGDAIIARQKAHGVRFPSES